MNIRPSLIAVIALIAAPQFEYVVAAESVATPALSHPVELAQVAVVRSNIVLLSDLLPSTAAPLLREKSQEVLLGTSPLPDRPRRFTSSRIEAAVSDFPSIRNQLRVPPEVEVIRWSRLLTPADIIHCIESSSESDSYQFSSPIFEADLRYLPTINVTEDTPQLKIVGIQRDPRKSVTHLRISIASEPGLPQFWVEIDRMVSSIPGSSTRDAGPAVTHKISESLGGGAVQWRNINPREPVHPSLEQRAVLVRIGQPVEVVASTGAMRLTTMATSLGPGREGDIVRVRSVDNGRVFSGTVVGPQTIEVRF